MRKPVVLGKGDQDIVKYLEEQGIGEEGGLPFSTYIKTLIRKDMSGEVSSSKENNSEMAELIRLMTKLLENGVSYGTKQSETENKSKEEKPKETPVVSTAQKQAIGSLLANLKKGGA